MTTSQSQGHSADKDALLTALRGGDGYPTDEGLQAVSTFTGSAHELVTLLYEATKAYGVVTIRPFDDEYGREKIEVYTATGGWSGNESIMSALKRSFFWVAYWESSKRGGAFTFHVPADRWDTPMPDWPPAHVIASAKHPEYPCPTEGCPGDARYRPPGLGHAQDCTYGRVIASGEDGS